MSRSSQTWYYTLPTLSFYYFNIALVVTLLTTFYPAALAYIPLHLQAISWWETSTWLYLIPNTFINLCFFGKFFFDFLFYISLLGPNLPSLEKEMSGPVLTAHLYTCLTFMLASLLLLAYHWVGFIFLGPSFLMCCLVFWCFLSPKQHSTFLGFVLARQYLPILWTISAITLNASPTLVMIGCVIGWITAQLYHYQWLQAPAFLILMAENQQWGTNTNVKIWMRKPGQSLTS